MYLHCNFLLFVITVLGERNMHIPPGRHLQEVNSNQHLYISLCFLRRFTYVEIMSLGLYFSVTKHPSFFFSFFLFSFLNLLYYSWAGITRTTSIIFINWMAMEGWNMFSNSHRITCQIVITSIIHLEEKLLEKLKYWKFTILKMWVWWLDLTLRTNIFLPAM